MKTEINKKQVCFSVLAAHLVVAENGDRSFSEARKLLLGKMYDALVEEGIDKHDISQNLLTSYYQMGRMEYITGKGAYAHHKYKKVEKKEEKEGICVNDPDLLNDIVDELTEELDATAQVA